MMKNRITFLTVLFLTALIVVSCSKEDAFNYSDLEHSASWIFPIATTKLSAERFTKINDLRYDVGVFTLDAQFVNPGFPIPPTGNQTIGPVDLDDQDSIYVQFRSNDALIKIYITNNFPINIKGGTVVEIRNSVNNTDVVFSGVIQNDIPAKGGMDSVIINKTVTSDWVDNKLKLYLTNFGSDGSPNVEDFETYSSIGVSIGIEVLSLDEIELYGNLNFLVSDTTDFEFGDNESQHESEEQNIQNIKMNVFDQNGTPLTFALRGYFLDANKAILDSVFENAIVPSAPVNADGYIIPSGIVEEKIVGALNASQYASLKYNTKHIYYKLEFSSESQNVKVLSGNSIRLEVTSEIESKVSL
jgi:hypothetical protein